MGRWQKSVPIKGNSAGEPSNWESRTEITSNLQGPILKRQFSNVHKTRNISLKSLSRPPVDPHTRQLLQHPSDPQCSWTQPLALQYFLAAEAGPRDTCSRQATQAWQLYGEQQEICKFEIVIRIFTWGLAPWGYNHWFTCSGSILLVQNPEMWGDEVEKHLE